MNNSMFKLNQVTTRGYVYTQAFLTERLIRPLKKNKGLGSIELVVLIMVLVGLALLFKTKITEFLTTLTGQLNAADINNKVK